MPSDTPKGPYYSQNGCVWLRATNECLSLSVDQNHAEVFANELNTLHAENERLREAASRVISAHRSHIDNTPHPNDKHENERRDSLIALRTALENRP